MVIQRWQSVLLLVAAVMMSLFSFLTIGSIENGGVTYSFDTLGLHASAGDSCSTWAFFVLSLLSAILPLINIFKYRTLKLQRTLCVVESVILLSVIAIEVFYAFFYLPEASVRLGWVSFTPLVAIITDLWAHRLIGSDMKKLRDSDRLR
ncbi:MAG: DUF4293 domain-containing protein [Lepagella sp.]